MSDLNSSGRNWVRNITLAKDSGLEAELEYVRFRDGDMSIKGGAILGFAGLMMATDLVFLSAGPESYISPVAPFGTVAFGALFALFGGAVISTWSIIKGNRALRVAHEDPYAFLGALKAHHKSRKRLLDASAWLTVLASSVVLLAIAAPHAIGIGP